MLTIKSKISLILVEDPPNELKDSAITAEAEYPINLSEVKEVIDK